MIFSKMFLSLVFFIIFSSIISCNKLNKDSEAKIVRTSAQSIPSDKEIEKKPVPVTGSIIKKPKTQRSSKRVKFADQVLDDSIGTEPLDSKDVEIKSTRGKEVKQKPNVEKKNGASQCKSTLALTLFCAALTMCLIYPFN